MRKLRIIFFISQYTQSIYYKDSNKFHETSDSKVPKTISQLPFEIPNSPNSTRHGYEKIHKLVTTSKVHRQLNKPIYTRDHISTEYPLNTPSLHEKRPSQ